MQKKLDNTAKEAPVKKKGKVGAPAGNCNNPRGRIKGSKNKISYDVRKMIWEKVSDVSYIDGVFDDISKVEEYDKRAKLKIELVKLFVPRPLNDDEQKDKDIKSAIWEQLSGQTMNEEDDF